MILSTIKIRIAENLNQLASDGSTIREGLVTESGISNKIQDIYKEELFPLFSDKYPTDFAQWTYPQATYTATSTIASVSSTTLTVDDPIFQNNMEGFNVENSDADEKIKIATYTSHTQVVMTSSVEAWSVGDTVYVLGNEFTFGGATTDLKEALELRVKYTANTDNFTVCDPNDIRSIYSPVDEVDESQFSEEAPKVYLTSIDVGGVTTPAVGILPYPTSYQGKIKLRYIERPADISDTIEPVLNVAGLSEVIINGVTAWGKRIKGDTDWGDWYTLYKSGQMELMTNYKPKHKFGPRQMNIGKFGRSIQRRTI